jgi:hypothetical protein
MQVLNSCLEHFMPQKVRSWSSYTDPKCRALVFLTLLLPLYVIAVSSFPARILMDQQFDDALYIRLGHSIADGNWLGAYDELTLVKAPIYPVFLAASSFTGIPFNILQHCLFFLGCAYLANVVCRVCQSTVIGTLLFAVIVTCPSYYTTTRVIRDPLYTALTLFLVGSWMEVFLLDRLKRARLFLAAVLGVLSAAYWLTREEGIWILPCLAVISVGGIVNRLAGGSSELGKLALSGLFSRLIVVSLFASLTAVGIGLLNKMAYGSFVLIEMSEANFQRALGALQRVGASYNRPYLPLPREARALVYAESTSFAKLKPFLDPPDNGQWINVACRILPSTCGDIGGGWFMWALRDAAAKAGMHETPKKAAAFYHSLAHEVESACETGRLKCSAWLPPIVSGVPAAEWHRLPKALLKSFGLLLYLPPPAPPDQQPSDLSFPGAAEALEFLNRPYHQSTGEYSLAPTKAKLLIRHAWLQLLNTGSKIDTMVITLGILSLLLAVGLWPGRAVGSGIFIIIVASAVAVLTRCLLLAVIEISSFPAVFHVRMLPAEPLAILGALLSIYLFIILASGPMRGCPQSDCV